MRFALKVPFEASMGLWPCFCQTPVLGLGLGVDFTFTLDNKNNNKNNHNDNHNDNNPHLKFLKGTVLGVKEQGLGIKVKG